MTRDVRFQTRLLCLAFIAFSPALCAAQNATFVAPQHQEFASFSSVAQQAAAARDQGRTDEALRLYQRGVRLNPRWDEGWWYVGTLAYDQDQYAEAIPAFRSLVALNPKLGPAWAFLGLCEFETGDYKNALMHLERAHSLGGGDSEGAKVADYHLALLLNRAGDFDRAASVLAPRAANGVPGEQIQVALGMSLLHVPLLPAEVDPSKDALLHMAGAAASSLAKNDNSAAAEALQQLADEHPDVPFVHYAYGSVLASLHRYEDADQQLRAEIKLQPASALPYMQLAVIALRTNHVDQALSAAEQAVKLSPKSAGAHRLLAKVLGEAGKREQAAVEVATAQKLGPEPPSASPAIARLYRRGIEPVTTAKNSTLAPGANFESLSHDAEVARQAGNIDQAIRDYQAALGVRHDWAEGWWNLGILDYQTKQFSQAVPAFKTLVSLNPAHSEGWALLGLSEYETGDYKNALLHLERGRQLGYKGNEAALHLTNYRFATLLILDREFDKAIDVLTPEVSHGTPGDDLKTAFGLALLRVPQLPEKVDPSRLPLIREAGQAAVLLAGSRYDQAFPIFERLLEQYPTTPFLHYAYGMALASISRYDEAEPQLQKEIRLQPEADLPYTNLALIDLKTYRADAALPLATKAVQLAPKSAEAHYVFGRALLESGKTDQAIKQLEVASGLKPGSPEIHFNLARAYSKAKLPDQAKRERNTFARLNAVAEREKSASGSQVYGESADRGGLQPHEVDSTSPAPQ